MIFNKIKMFFSKKEQIKKIFEYLKEDEYFYFSLLIINKDLINPFFIMKIFFILKKELPHKDYWWYGTKYWFSCILYFLILILISIFLLFNIKNLYISLSIISIVFLSFIFFLHEKIISYIEFCYIVIRKEKSLSFFMIWLFDLYSKIEKNKINKKTVEKDVLIKRRL